jgi:hypothetical protein
VHKKIAFSGKKFVQFDDDILLDNFSKLWYNGSLRPPGRWGDAQSLIVGLPGRPF